MTSTHNEIFRATCFGPGRPPQGEPVSVGIDSSGLLLPLKDAQEERVFFDQLRVSSGGFDHDQMILTWRQGSGTGSLVLADPDSKKRFLSHAPPLLAPPRKNRRPGVILLVLLILIPLFLALGVWLQSDRIASWVVGRISIDSERQIGNLIYGQTEPGLEILTDGEVVKTVDDIGRRLAKNGPYSFEWHVAEDPAVNAFAIPGGHVVVFTGLIRATDSPEELAGVLAHEIEHVVQRHSLRGLVHNLGWQAVLTIALGEWGGGGAWGEFAEEMGRLNFGRHQESEADLKGLARLKGAEIDPKGMITFFEKLSKEEGLSIPLLATHPSSVDRVAALRAEINRIGPWKGKPLPYDWKKIKAELK